MLYSHEWNLHRRKVNKADRNRMQFRHAVVLRIQKRSLKNQTDVAHLPLKNPISKTHIAIKKIGKDSSNEVSDEISKLTFDPWNIFRAKWTPSLDQELRVSPKYTTISAENLKTSIDELYKDVKNWNV